MHRDSRRQFRYGGENDPVGEHAEFVGSVDYVGAEPGFISGFIGAYQTLGVTITDARSGPVGAGDRVEVDVLIAGGYPFVTMGSTGVPALDSSVVQPGVLVLFAAAQEYGRWRCTAISTDGPQAPSQFVG
jgi:hypothetical protein